MQKNAVLQVRIDAASKEQAERIYGSMGTSLSEAVRMFVAQSVIRRRLPFQPVTHHAKDGKLARGALASYADPAKRPLERETWLSAFGTWGPRGKEE